MLSQTTADKERRITFLKHGKIQSKKIINKTVKKAVLHILRCVKSIITYFDSNWLASRHFAPQNKIGQIFVSQVVSKRRKGPCKRTQHCWPTTPNIVGPNNVVTCCVRLHGTTTMLALVDTCCVQFETGQTFRPMQTDATFYNNGGSCWHLLRPFAWALTS